VRVLPDASRSPGVSLSLSVGKTTVDENIMCGCVGVLGGMYLCWVVVEITYFCVVWCPCRLGYDSWLFYFRCGM
jgi:hypothetical protein